VIKINTSKVPEEITGPSDSWVLLVQQIIQLYFIHYISALANVKTFSIFRSVLRVIKDRLANHDIRDRRSSTGRSPGYHAALLPSSAGAGANQPGRAYYYALQVTGK